MKKNNLFLILISILFISCNPLVNSIDNDEKPVKLENGYYEIPVTINISNDIKAVATPDYSSYVTQVSRFRITATGPGGYGTIITNISNTDGVFKGSIILSNGDWTITAQGLNSSGVSLYRNDITQIQTYDPSSNEPLIIYVYPLIYQSSGETYTGSAELKVTFPKITDGLRNKYLVAIDVDGTTNEGGQKKISLSSSTTTEETFNFDNLSAGNHHMNLFIYPDGVTETTDYIRIPGSLHIAANMCTTKWWKNGISSDTLVLTFADLQFPEDLYNYAFYVCGSNPGVLTSDLVAAIKMGKSKAVRFDTIQDAVDTIEKIDPTGEREWEIGIDGMITGTSTNNFNDANTLVVIGNSSATPKIKIKGYNSLSIPHITGNYTACIFPNNGTRAIGLNKFKGFTVEDIRFMNANINVAGGAIDYNGGCNADASINIKQCCFSENSGSQGGAVCIGHTATGYEVDCIIDSCCFSNNKGVYGGAVYWSNLKSSEHVIKNSQFVQNGNTSSSMAQGSAVLVMTGELDLDNCDFDNNISSINTSPYGASIYNYVSVTKLTLSDVKFINSDHYDIYNEAVIGIKSKNTINNLYLNTSKPGQSLTILSGFDKYNNTIKFSMDSYEADKVVFTKDSACTTEIEQIISCFTCLNTDYEIAKDISDATKAILKEKTSSVTPGGGLSVDTSDLTFSFYPEIYSFSKPTSGTNQVSIVKKINGSTSAKWLSSDFTAKVYYNGGTAEVDSSQISITAPDGTASGGIITINSSVYPDEYYVEITGTYNGLPVSEKIFFTVTE